MLAGPRAEVRALVGPGEDAHKFEPSPAQARLLLGAKGLVLNGLGFEPWAGRLANAVSFQGRMITASAGITNLRKDSAHGVDPHIWLDVSLARAAAATIAAGLAAIDPADKAGYALRAQSYDRELAALDAEIRALLAPIPAHRRTAVTGHAAFGYFGRAYGLQFLSAGGLATGAEPSAAVLADVIRRVRAAKAAAVFIENNTSARLADRVRQETGARAGGMLYAEALSLPGGPAPTYISLMRHNARTIAAALASQA
jgi:zinc/manganese transport system substrate-binding protein